MRAGQDFLVLVDYAHTPDSLENVLRTIREFAEGNIIIVLAAVGDRDRAKRPLMGEIAAQHSDYIYLTSDNPRSEDPQQIVLDIELGIKRVKADPSLTSPSWIDGKPFAKLLHKQVRKM